MGSEPLRVVKNLLGSDDLRQVVKVVSKDIGRRWVEGVKKDLSKRKKKKRRMGGGMDGRIYVEDMSVPYYVDFPDDEPVIIPGPQVPVDPMNVTDMVLANQVHENRLMARKNEIEEQWLKNNIGSLGTLMRGLSVEIMHDMELRGKIVDVIDRVWRMRDEQAGGLTHMASGALRAIGNVLWTIPGVNVTFGVLAHGGAAILDHIEERRLESRTHDMLMQARGALVENFYSNILKDGESPLNEKVGENSDISVRVMEWMSMIEGKIKAIEEAVSRKGAVHYGIQFWGFTEDVAHIMGLVLYFGGDDKEVMVVGINLKRNRVYIRNVCLIGDDYEEIRYNLKHVMLEGEYDMLRNPGHIILKSFCPFMALEWLFRERLDNLESMLEKFGGDYVRRRMMVLSFLQSGVY